VILTVTLTTAALAAVLNLWLASLLVLDRVKDNVVGSTGRRNGSGEGSPWCPKAKRFLWPGVELECDRVEFGLAVSRQVGAFWEVLP